MLLGPDTGMSTYSGHPLVGTAGVPLVVYPGLKLNFLRPKFMRVIKDFVRIHQRHQDAIPDADR